MQRYMLPLLLGGLILGCQSSSTTPEATDQATNETEVSSNTKLISLKLPGMT